jgi:hypothetical protein
VEAIARTAGHLPVLSFEPGGELLLGRARR